MSTSYKASIFLDLSKTNNFKRDVRDLAICIVFLSATIREDDSFSSIYLSKV
jgi:Rad3-related DNA helicase